MSAEVIVDFFDTTLRDGAQALPDNKQFNEGTKPAIADAIASLGVGVIEAGFPSTKADTIPVQEVAQSVGQKQYEVRNWQTSEEIGRQQNFPVIAGLSRTTAADIETTWGAIQYARRPRIHTFISTDPEHMRVKFAGKTPEQVLTMGSQAVRLAREFTDEHSCADVEFSAEAATTTEEAYLERVVREMLQQGAQVINLPDTVGQRDPIWMYNFYKKVIGWVMSENQEAIISAHNHNDLGQANANTVMLVQAATYFAEKFHMPVRIQLETTICSLGERAGNADVFPVAASLFKFSPDYAAPVEWSFNPQNSVKVARAVMRFAHSSVPRQSPIVGRDTNRIRSGIHSDGVLKGGDEEGHLIYNAVTPTFWGHKRNAVHEEGQYQGKAGREAARAA